MPESDDSPRRALAPARYVGHQRVLLQAGAVYRNLDGTPRDTRWLTPGDTLLIPASELYGQTYLADPTGLTSDARWLGVGVALLPQHAGQERAALIGAPFLHEGRVWQYEFHDGRGDFQPADAPWEGAAAATPDAAPPADSAPAASAPARKAATSSPSSSSLASSPAASSTEGAAPPVSPEE
ncbi:MAG: hypothetical protein KGK07_17170 [Chloroflexota bacterium]|nr:hypothetical protein [Chloroflexota bacterium]